MMNKVERRILNRNAVKIPAVVRGAEDSENSWVESATIITLSQNSMGLIINREYQIGRLLLIFASAPIPLVIPCEEDHEENYSVWGIVQHCSLTSKGKENESYHYGIGIIGKEPPPSFVLNPLQNYRLCGVNEDGFWKVTETTKDFKKRKHPRLNIWTEAFLGQMDEQNKLSGGEKVWTENISSGGAAVFSNLELKVGDCVKLIVTEYEFSALAVVREINSVRYYIPKICLEFISGKFPVEKLPTSK